MKVKIEKTPLKDLLVIEIQSFKDDRGFFVESWNKKDFEEVGLSADFVQDNHSGSVGNVIRGLHYQNTAAPIAKLVKCIQGKIYDVAVDLRTKSSTFGKYHAVELSERNGKQIFVPVGFAHGFATMEDWCEVQYKQTGYYDPQAEGTIIWNDPDLNIAWPVKNPTLSEKDRNAQNLKEYLKNPAF